MEVSDRGRLERGAFFIGRSMRKRVSEHGKPISELLEQMEAGFGAHSAKATLLDYVRLVQLEGELVGDEPEKEVVVRWIDLEEPK